MKRFHVHVAVDDLAKNINFYSGLFGAQPTVNKDDYAKWMLDDPRINFAISSRGSAPGVNHMGLQAESAEELTGLHAQHQAAELAMNVEGATQCCYAYSNKHWLEDPQGIAWEVYHTMGEAQTFGHAATIATTANEPGVSDKHASTVNKATTACCAPAIPVATQTSCCS